MYISELILKKLKIYPIITIKINENEYSIGRFKHFSLRTFRCEVFT